MVHLVEIICLDISFIRISYQQVSTIEASFASLIYLSLIRVIPNFGLTRIFGKIC